MSHSILLDLSLRDPLGALSPEDRAEVGRKFTEALEEHGTWIYVIQAGHDRGPVKIGRSSDPGRRLRELQHSHAETLRIVGAWRDVPSYEQELHKAYAHLRLRGEWFEPHWSLLEEAERLNTWRRR